LRGPDLSSSLPARYTREAFSELFEKSKKYILDPVDGSWYMETTRTGKLMGDGGTSNPRKADDRTARAMMNVARMLKRLAA
jgi:hypothetical protein